MAADSSDFIYGTIFVLYVALFIVVGGYMCTRSRRNKLEEGDTQKEEEDEAVADQGSPEQEDEREGGRGRKKED